MADDFGAQVNEVTQILSAIDRGDPTAADQLLPLVYTELRKLAAQHLTHEKPGQTLQATALVHDAYLRLVGGEAHGRWNSRGHFFAAAAEAMRRILVENARRKGRIKHGGEFKRLELSDVASPTESTVDELLAVNDALARLEAVDPAAANLVKLRHFAGFTMPDVAEALGFTLRTAERNWTFARTWLKRDLAREAAADHSDHYDR